MNNFVGHNYNTRSRARATEIENKINTIKSVSLKLPSPHIPIKNISVEDKKTVYKNEFESAYYNPRNPGSFSGINALQRQLKGEKSQKEIVEWFQAQPTYTLHKPVRKRFRRNVIVV